MSPPPKLSRRGLTIGGIAVAVAAAVAGVYEVPRLFKPRAKGQYADLVNLLDEPDKAAIVGRTFRQNGYGPTIEELAEADLKKRLHNRALPALIEEDLPRLDRMVEADGWVIPFTLATVCILAAASV